MTEKLVHFFDGDFKEADHRPQYAKLIHMIVLYLILSSDLLQPNIIDFWRCALLNEVILHQFLLNKSTSVVIVLFWQDL